MNKKISLGAAIAFCLIVVAATLSAALIFSMRAYNSRLYNLPERERMYDKVAEVDDQVRQNYIGAVTETELRDSLARGYLEGIGDEYAEYYSAAEYQRLQEDYTSQSVQIGIVTRMDESGYMLITQVYPDSPAQAAGIQAGDLIVRIDDEDITAENYAETASRLYGEAGTTLTIILRRGVEDTSMEMTRRFVEVPTVQGAMLENQVGLVQIQEFNNVTPDQFTRMVDGMIDSGAQALIFDVRGVNSATLYSVAQTLDRLVPEGTLASSTDKNGETTVLEYSDERQVNLPMAVLVDGRTEGEAELFAADIREFGKGSIVGTQTAGKGTIQTLIPLNDGSAIRLTTARINSAGGASYDGVGVKPDFEVPLETGERAQLASDTGEVDPTLLVESDPQLRRAVEVVLNGIRATTPGAADELTVPGTSSGRPVELPEEPVSSEPEDPDEEEASSETEDPDEEDTEEEDTDGEDASGEEDGDTQEPASDEEDEQPASSGGPAGSIDLSYRSASGETVEVYAVSDGAGYYNLVDADGQALGVRCSGAGSPSGITSYRSQSGALGGSVIGVRAADGSILYGVMDIAGDYEWVVTCMYTDIQQNEDGRYVGVVSGGGTVLLD